MKKQKIKIDVVSDVVCPWCYIGKRRLDKAVAQLENDYEIELHYHPYELNPNIPMEGYDQKSFQSRKFGGPQKYNQITNHVTKIAAEEGLEYNIDKQNILPNTFDSHRIIWLAGTEGKQSVLLEALFKAYFQDGIDLSNRENLVKIAISVGLDPTKVNELVQSNAGAQQVKEMALINRENGVTGVPFYIINNKYAITGAQSAETFIKVLNDIASAPEETGGESCDSETGNCN